MAHIFHFVPPNLTGSHLIPLNKMTSELPEIHKAEISKYAGREKILQRKIPKLNCLWNDVLHFSAVDPRLILERLIQLGFGTFEGQQWYKVPVEMIAHLPTVVYRAPSQPRADLSLSEDDTEIFEAGRWHMPVTLPLEAERYFQKCVEDGTRPFPFQFIPHILVRGEIEVSNLEKETLG
jgi:hypothetical protein